MRYFVTGATGFIGKRLVKTLLGRRGATVHFLLRPESRDKLPDLFGYWGIDGSTGKVAFDQYGDSTNKVLTVYKVDGGKWVAEKTGTG